MAKILLFGNNLGVFIGLAEALSKAGHDVIFTAGETEEKDFDLLLIDPVIDPTILRGVQNVHFEGVAWLVTGLEFLRRLRQAGVTSPALILAALSRQMLEESWKGSFDSLGYYRFLSLPATLSRILTEVERLLVSVSLQPEGSAP